MEPKAKHYNDLDDYSIMASAIGNALTSGLSHNVITYCLINTTSAKEFDTAIARAIQAGEKLNNMM